MTNANERAILDAEHLKLLSWAYAVSGSFSLLYSVMPALMSFGFGAIAVVAAFSSESQPAREGAFLPFALFAAFGMVGFVLSAGFGSLKLYAGLCIHRRRRRALCLVIAALSCLGFPYGTILGVATFAVLQKESVIRAFAASATTETADVLRQD